MLKGLPFDLRRNHHGLRFDGVLREVVTLFLGFTLGFRFKKSASKSTLSIENLREEVLITIATENQSRSLSALVDDIIDVEACRRAVGRVVNDQCTVRVVGVEPINRIFARLKLLIANHEIEWDVCMDIAVEACKPTDCHGNDHG